MWMAPRGKPLTYSDKRIIEDQRISVERPFTKDWNLHIRNVNLSDSGVYLCQINTNPVKSKKIHLHINGKNYKNCSTNHGQCEEYSKVYFGFDSKIIKIKVNFILSIYHTLLPSPAKPPPLHVCAPSHIRTHIKTSACGRKGY